MAENWIKINEIEFLPNELSKKYNEEKLYEKDIKEYNELEKMLNENALIKKLKQNNIPFKCEWEEREVKELSPQYFKKRFGGMKHYFVLIFIPKDYKSKYEEVFNVKNEKFVEQEDDEELVFEPIEKAKKIFNWILKSLFIFSLCCLVYMIILSALQNLN